MKTSSLTRPILLSAIIGLLALSLPKAFTALYAGDKSTVIAVPSQLAKEMIGAWVHVGKPGDGGEAPERGGRVKFRTGRHWTLTQADSKTGLVIEHFGGTYTLKGAEYVETIEHADAMNANDLKKSFAFTVKVDGDTMTQIGLGNPYAEVWKRLK